MCVFVLHINKKHQYESVKFFHNLKAAQPERFLINLL
uniref:Uncharacterized protein n=1 Tax=Anguilla anguilla TaxID=7936 RepID=A0A0E9QCN9_ANGAN